MEIVLIVQNKLGRFSEERVETCPKSRQFLKLSKQNGQSMVMENFEK